MRTLTGFEQALSGDGVSRPTFLVQLDTAGVSTATYYCTDNPNPWLQEYGAGLVSVSPVGAKCIPPERTIEVETIDLTFEDGWIRPIIAAGKTVLGGLVTVTFGLIYDRNDWDNSYWSYFKGYVTAIRQEPGYEHVTLEVSTVADHIRRKKITGYWVNDHPLDVINDVLITKLASEVDPALIDTSTLNPDSWSTFSHLVASKCSANLTQGSQPSPDNRLTKPTNALEVIQDLASMIDGSCYVDETGVFKFKLLDASGASVGDWTADDVRDVKPIRGPLINRVEYGFSEANVGGFSVWNLRDRSQSRQGTTRSLDDHLYVQENRTSQTKYAPPGTSWRTESYSISDAWTGAVAWIMDTSFGEFGAAETSAILYSGSAYRFSGSRDAYPTWASQPANAKISASRPMYLLTNAPEIIKVESFDRYSDGNIKTWQERDPEGSGTTAVTRWNWWTAGSITRGALGTSATAGATLAIDITAAEFVASRINARFGDGVELLEVSTSLRLYPHEIGDIVTLTWPDYLSNNFTGLTTSQKWEIVGKEVDVYNEKAPIKWTLCYITTSSPTKAHTGRGWLRNQDLGAIWQRALQKNEAAYRHRSNGFGFTSSGASRILTIGTGRANNGSYHSELLASLAPTLPASKDNYVTHNLTDNSIEIVPVTISDPAPPAADHSILLGKVTTDGTGVTATDTSGRPDYPFDGGRLVPATIVDSKIEANRSLVRSNVVDGSKNIDFNAGTGWVNKILDNLADGSTYLKLAGVSGSNLATTSSLTNKCVTAAKLGQDVFRAYRNTSVQTLGTSKGYTKVEFNADEYDTGSDFDAATNYYYTAPADTYVRFTAGVRVGNVDAGQILWLSLYSTTGPTEIARGQRYYNNEGAAANASLAADFGPVRLSSGDQIYLAIYFDVNQGSGITVTNGATVSWFAGEEVRIV